MVARPDLQTALTGLCGAALVVAWVAWPPLVHLSLAAGTPFAVLAAWRSLRDRSLDVNVLMLLAAIGAVAVGRPFDAGVLLFLFSLAGTLEARAMARTQSAIAGLIRLRPDTALRVEPGGEATVRVEELRVGDVVRVLPYQQVPVDGEVLEGAGEVSESAMTGEARPIAKSPGSAVLTGTQNLSSALVVRVTAAGTDTTLEKIVALVQEAQGHKASGERLSTWFGTRYTVLVLVSAVAALLVRVAFGGALADALYYSLVLLVALSPCALVISTPASTLSALAYAARRGILVRGGAFVELAGRVDTVAVDKTGTITIGRPVVVEICAAAAAPVPAGAPEPPGDEGIACWRSGQSVGPVAAQVLRFAASVESQSTHPIAVAVVEAARAADIEWPDPTEAKTVSGMGVTAKVDGQAVKIGQLRFFESESMPEEFREHVADLHARGLTGVVVRYPGMWAAVGLRDEPRPNARDLVRDLRDAGVRSVVMLTGDNEATARAIADEVGIDEFRAGLLPTDKAEIVGELTREGRCVLMVGDGVNDAPALALANVGVAMGGLGSDVALRAADVVLVQDRIERVPELIRLGKRANGVIRANLVVSVGAIFALAISALFFRLPLSLAVVGHEGTTVVVILNGLRLLKGATPGLRRR